MLNNLVLVSILVVFLFEGTFFLTLALIYQSKEKKALRIFNTFIFETTPSFKENNSFINYIFVFALIVNTLPFIFYLTKTANSYTVAMTILAVLIFFCLGCLPFISFYKLREHFYLDLGAIVSLLALFTIEAFCCFYVYKNNDYLNNRALAGMIISIVFGVLMLIPVFNPKLFDLKNKKNEDGTMSRKNFIFLAFVEWMLYPMALLSLLPIFLITMA